MSVSILSIAVVLVVLYAAKTDQPTTGQPTRALPAVTCRPDGQPATQSAVVSVNGAAILAYDGSPLPSNIKADIVIELIAADSNVSYIFHDSDTGNWELVFSQTSSGSRFCILDSSIFAYNSVEAGWDEVDPDSLSQDVDIRQYLLSDQELVDFNGLAVQLDNQNCDSYTCAVWYVETNDPEGSITIRVNQFTRKIFDVVIADDDGVLTLRHHYQAVDIQPPGVIRYLQLEPSASH